jgi:hypothetical protein
LFCFLVVDGIEFRVFSVVSWLEQRCLVVGAGRGMDFDGVSWWIALSCEFSPLSPGRIKVKMDFEDVSRWTVLRFSRGWSRWRLFGPREKFRDRLRAQHGAWLPRYKTGDGSRIGMLCCIVVCRAKVLKSLRAQNGVAWKFAGNPRVIEETCYFFQASSVSWRASKLFS